MLLAVDIGNTNIVIGVYNNKELVFSGRFYTNDKKTKDEISIDIHSFLFINGCCLNDISGAIVSSVVPKLTRPVCSAIKALIGTNALVIGPGIKTGLDIKIDNPSQLGADMVCVSVCAIAKYPVPSIVVDLGTATKISTIDKNGHMIGGAIMAGVMVSLEALGQKAALLQQISLDNPVELIGTNTIDSMKSGAILGTASMIDGMIKRYRAKLGENLTVIATGGLCDDIIPHCEEEISIASLLGAQRCCFVSVICISFATERDIILFELIMLAAE